MWSMRAMAANGKKVENEKDNNTPEGKPNN